MKQILYIIQREFLMAVNRKAYVVSVVVVPLVILLFGFVIKYSVSQYESTKDQATIGIVDQTGLVDFELAEAAQQQSFAETELRISGSDAEKQKYKIERYENVEVGITDVKQEKLTALYVVENDYLRTGNVRVYVKESWRITSGKSPGLDNFQTLLRSSLLNSKVSSETLNRVVTPTSLEELAIGKNDSIGPVQGKWQKMNSFIAPFGLSFVLILAIFISTGYLLQSTVEEKENRVIEVMLSTVTPDQLLWGKVLGLGGAALLQVVLYLTLFTLTSSYGLITVDLRPKILVLSIAFTVAGYLLFAGLLAATGIIGGKLRESSQAASVWTFIAMSPFWFLSILVDSPNGTVARILSFFPLTSPVTMIFRLSFTAVPATDIVISLGLLVISAYASVRVSAKIFRAASLLYGKRPTVPEIFRWMREA